MKTKRLLLGLDIGTSSLKAVLFDPDAGKVVRSAARPTPVSHPKGNWSEHDPQALWETTVDCIREAAGGQPVMGVAISSMAEAGVLMGENGEALAPIIAWYDRRSEPQVGQVEAQISIADLYRITGQRVNPSFSLTKLLWMRQNWPDVFEKAARWLPVPAFLLWKLSGAAAVDYTIAARTLLFDQNTLNWSKDLLEKFHIKGSLLPAVLPGGAPVGRLLPRAAAQAGLPEGAVCVLGGHDHLCAALASGACSPEALVDSTGSANALLLLLSHFLPDPALAERGYASYAYLLQGLFALKGGLKAAGSAIDWLARQFSPGAGEPIFADLEREAWRDVGRKTGPVWLPHFIGSGTPQGDRFSRAAVIGLQMEHQPADLFRGLLESIAFWTRQNIEELAAMTRLSIPSLTLTGGVTRLKLLSQLKADILNRPVKAAQVPEAAATGAALLAGLGTGIFTGAADALAALRYDSELFEPDAARAAWYEPVYLSLYLPLYTALRPLNHAYETIARNGAPG